MAGADGFSSEAAQSLGFIVILPLTFASSAFVPVESMPGWLEAFAAVNPDARGRRAPRALPRNVRRRSIWGTLAWSLGLALVFATLAITRYRRAVLR